MEELAVLWLRHLLFTFQASWLDLDQRNIRDGMSHIQYCAHPVSSISRQRSYLLLLRDSFRLLALMCLTTQVFRRYCECIVMTRRKLI